MNKIIVPPIKSQGIKTKLVPLINELVYGSGVKSTATWFEPFFGTGVVGFNAPLRGKFIVGDSNPHLINFYRKIADGTINKYTARGYLEEANRRLSTSAEQGYDYFREVRDRFNREFDSFDFLFLSRAGFNGMMRFNKNGLWNVPFCKKPQRFSPAYITKICNQIDNVAKVIAHHEWSFNTCTFLDIISKAGADDIIYCDPPYFGRSADYYNGWTLGDEQALYDALSQTKAKFILSTWHHNEFRANEMIERFWKAFNVLTQEHFYHNGGYISNRHAMVEAIVCNFEISESNKFMRSSRNSRCEPDLFTAITA